jgi:hypothetical protein
MLCIQLRRNPHTGSGLPNLEIDSIAASRASAFVLQSHPNTALAEMAENGSVEEARAEGYLSVSS